MTISCECKRFNTRRNSAYDMFIKKLKCPSTQSSSRGRRAIQYIRGPLSPAHRIIPNIRLMVPRIEMKHKKEFRIKDHRSNEYYRMHWNSPTGVCPGGKRRDPRVPMGTTALQSDDNITFQSFYNIICSKFHSVSKFCDENYMKTNSREEGSVE